MIFPQIFDILDIGIVVLDNDLQVFKWNRWMELHSGIAAEQIIGRPIFDFYPHLNNPRFQRSCKCVLSLGNLYFFSQKLHKYLFPFKPVSTFNSRFEYMQQCCNMGPLLDDSSDKKYIYITVRDVTEIAIYEQRLIEMNMIDWLTGIYNRRFLELRLKEEFERYKRYSKPFSLVMFDLDHFKRVNDTYGHLCGDFILQAITSLFNETIRNIDLLFRYGGEEFCCILPETDILTAEAIAERYRTTVARHTFKFQEENLQITISMGVAGFTKETGSPNALIEHADQALYEAKRTGRNKVVLADYTSGNKS